MKKRALYSIMALVLVLGMALTLATPVGAATPTFSGNAETDFTGPGILIIPDPDGQNLNVTQGGAPAGTISGWDMKDLRLTYNATTDTLYVGMNTYGIAGDADGDGDPGSGHLTYFPANDGQDYPDLDDSEAVSVFFDLNQDMTYDVIEGVPGTTDITGFRCGNWTGLASSFDADFPSHKGTYYGSPNSTAPDFEFTVLNFSTLPGQDALLAGFRVGAFMGSLDDGNIGEDYINYEQSPATNVSIVCSAAKVLYNHTVTLNVTEYNSGSVNLTSPQVVVTQNGGVLLTLASPPDSGDASDPGVLDVGETWHWNNRSSNPITGTTTFNATGSGTAPGDFLVTYPADPGERATVTVNTIAPNTTTTIAASAKTVVSGGSVLLSVNETNTGTDNLTNPYVEVWNQLTHALITTVTNTSGYYLGGDNGNGILDPLETWRWGNIPSGAINAATTFNASGFGTDSLGDEISYAKGYPSERATVTVNTITPSTVTHITANATLVAVNGSVKLTVTEWNNGGDNLTNPYVEVWTLPHGAVPVANLTRGDVAHWVGGDTADTGVLNVGETWNWTNILSNNITGLTTFEALGFGTDSFGNVVKHPGCSSERATVDVNVRGENCLKICKFEDANVNGVWDPGEPGLRDWRFHVTGPVNYDNWVTTESDGCIVLTNLVSGEYTVTEELKNGWYNTEPGGNPPYEQKVTVGIGAGCAQVDFGNREEIRDLPPIPTMNKWGIIAMIILFTGLVVWTVRRKRLVS